MPNVLYKGPLEDSSFRRMAMGVWDAPSDPSIYGYMDLDMRAAMARLEALKAEGHRVTITHLVARACAMAIGSMGDLNAMPRLGRAYQRESVDIFIQVALPSEDGLTKTDLSGVKIRAADTKPLEVFAAEFKEKAERVRSGKDKELKASKKSINRTPRWLMGPMLKLLRFVQYTLNFDLRWMGVARDPFGSALVSSVGMLGVDGAFAPLFPIGGPPIVMTVGAVTPRPIVDADGQVIAAPVLRLGGTFDHRVYDGYHLAAFGNTLRRLLEQDVDDL
jgi:pyruvate dehydrogenase E2 component (dihydrolipoamide acetyltransferase)